MFFKILRGAKEIGGSCVGVWTDNTRILLDFGMPLVGRDGKEFEFNNFKGLGIHDLITRGVLPDIKGLYTGSNELVDGVLISHPHQDHYGLSNYINQNVKFYLGEATHKIIELNNLFTSQELTIENTQYFEKEKAFQVGDFIITPYWADHSAFDAYSFLIEANGKRIFYSGDFRNHGRKAKAFQWFTQNAPQDVECLLLEGTTIGRESQPLKSETDIENELIEVFSQPDKINLIYSSGQNVDRIVSVYRACIRSNKILVVDVYIATILKELSKFARIPYPSKKFENLKVMFPYFTNRRLKNEGNEKVFYQFKNYKITKEEISNQAGNIVMMVRPSMQKDLAYINNIDNGNLIYSMWEGFLPKSNTKDFINYLINRNVKIYKIHTSGHADVETLKRMVEAIKPKYIVPIHTFSANQYQKIFSIPIVELNDVEIKQV